MIISINQSINLSIYRSSYLPTYVYVYVYIYIYIHTYIYIYICICSCVVSSLLFLLLFLFLLSCVFYSHHITSSRHPCWECQALWLLPITEERELSLGDARVGREDEQWIPLVATPKKDRTAESMKSWETTLK